MTEVDTLCICCMTNPRNIRFFCGHSSYCIECFKELTVESNFSCPMCRKNHTSVIILDVPGSVYEPPKPLEIIVNSTITPDLTMAYVKRLLIPICCFYYAIVCIITAPFIIAGGIIYFAVHFIWPWKFFKRSNEDFSEYLRPACKLIAALIAVSPVFATCPGRRYSNECYIGTITTSVLCVYMILIQLIMESIVCYTVHWWRRTNLFNV